MWGQIEGSLGAMEAASQVAKPSLADQHSRGYQAWPEVSDHSRIKRGRAKNRMPGKPRGRQPVFLMFKFKQDTGGKWQSIDAA